MQRQIGCDGRNVSGYGDGVDVYVGVAYIRPCQGRITCNGSMKCGSLGVVVIIRIGE